MLTHWDGLTPGAAARVLGLNAAQARTRLYRARRTLRRALAGEFDRSSPTTTPRSAHDAA
jgi:DNA-directed RNA polymerase specialized sigma24 family protein